MLDHWKISLLTNQTLFPFLIEPLLAVNILFKVLVHPSRLVVLSNQLFPIAWDANSSRYLHVCFKAVAPMGWAGTMGWSIVGSNMGDQSAGRMNVAVLVWGPNQAQLTLSLVLCNHISGLVGCPVSQMIWLCQLDLVHGLDLHHPFLKIILHYFCILLY